MKRLVLVLLLLSGCATHPEYKPYSEQTEADWKECNRLAIKDYYDSRSAGGSIVGGVLLGPLGAVIGDSVSNNDATVTRADVPILIDKCMTKLNYKKHLT